MIQSSATLQQVRVFTAPDSGLTAGFFSIKIGSPEGPIIQCTVLIGVTLTRTDAGKDFLRICKIQKAALVRIPRCLQFPASMNALNDEAYICSCGRHLAHRGDTPLAVCQILQLPEGVQFESSSAS